MSPFAFGGKALRSVLLDPIHATSSSPGRGVSSSVTMNRLYNNSYIPMPLSEEFFLPMPRARSPNARRYTPRGDASSHSPNSV